MLGSVTGPLGPGTVPATGGALNSGCCFCSLVGCMNDWASGVSTMLAGVTLSVTRSTRRPGSNGSLPSEPAAGAVSGLPSLTEAMIRSRS